MDVKVVNLFMQGVDVVSAVERQGGMEPYQELLELFYMDGKKRADLLKELVDSEDIDRYVIEVHGLKGAAGNIGANKLSEMAKQHEMAGKSSDTAFIRENCEELFRHYGECLAEIERVLKKQQFGQFAEKDLAGLPAIEEEEVTAKIREIYEQLDNFESKEAAAGVEELLGFAVSTQVRELLEQAKELLKMYEDEKAQNMLDGYLQGL